WGARRHGGAVVRWGGVEDAGELRGLGAPRGGVVVAGEVHGGVMAVCQGLMKVLPAGVAATAWPRALPCREGVQGRNHMVQPLSQRPGRGRPGMGAGAPGGFLWE